ncbi:hypothetical protein K1719_014610 [Acacia pycnantha]|nr:hypothetical protein K1719_014610 [Acacia pycnantha]
MMRFNAWRRKGKHYLIGFKDALGNGSSLVRWSSWGSKQHNKRDCCQWEGVLCNNQTGHIIKLHLPGDFPNLPLKGEIHTSLMELPQLKYLNLSFNYFEDGSIPQFLGSLRHLRYLDLHDCRLGGKIPSQLGLVSHLQYLDISRNFAEGAILYQLRNLLQLQHLDLSQNHLGGVIPYQLENLSQLRHLDVSWNTYLTGSIPHQLGNLMQLQHLDLSGSSLTGSIPYQLRNLSQLQYLDLSDSFLEGAIPYQLGNLSNLQNLLLIFAGTLNIIDQENGVGHEWLSSLSSLTLLWLGDMAHLKYSHKWLQIIAKLPNLKELIIEGSDLSDEYILSLPSLKFNSSSSLSNLEFWGNSFKSSTIFHWILNISTNLVDLDLSSNHLEGPIPYDEFASMMNSLENLYLLV